jgi:TonB family protein
MPIMIQSMLLLVALSPQHTRIGEVLTISNGLVTPPQITSYASAAYTDEALRIGVEGVVTVEAAFDIAGNFRVLRVVAGLGAGLDEQALEALRGWRFAPAYNHGSRVSVIAQIDVLFTLPNKDLYLRLMQNLVDKKIKAVRALQDALKHKCEAEDPVRFLCFH